MLLRLRGPGLLGTPGLRLLRGAIEFDNVAFQVTPVAVACSRTGDPSSGEFADAKLIRKFGEVADDLNTL